MSDSNHQPSMQILIIEDDDDARQNLRDILQLKNHHVTSAGSVGTMLDSANDLSHIDVIVLDRKLPDGLAEELLPRFRQLAPAADVVVVTGYADLQSTISALREGVSDYILKPINPDVLFASLERIQVRRDMEAELRAEREFAEMLLGTAEAIVLVLDSKGTIVRFNRYLTELTGHTLSDTVGQNWFETFIPERERGRLQDVFRQIVDHSTRRGIVNPILTKDGQEREIRWSNTIFNQGDAIRVLAVGMDITDLMQAQRDLLQSERLATIGQTMTGLAHESRNALQRLQNAVDLLEDDLRDNPSALRDLSTIARASHDLRDLLEEVREYASPIHLDATPNLLSTIWRRAWSDVETLHPERELEFTEQIGDDCELDVDRRRMEQVFRNLFENAIDACSSPAKIEVQCDMHDGKALVAVQDNGPGVPIRDRTQAFNAFFTTKTKGTGLGLAIVHRIVEAHGGQIEIVPNATGARFELQLPRP